MKSQRFPWAARGREAARHVLRRCGAMAFDLVDRVAAEFFQKRVRQHERDHRFADDGRRRDGADVAALDRRRCVLQRGQVTDRSGFISVAMGFMNP